MNRVVNNTDGDSDIPIVLLIPMEMEEGVSTMKRGFDGLSAVSGLRGGDMSRRIRSRRSPPVV